MTENITLVGNIASLPEHTRTPSGVSILTFRLASKRRRFDAKTGQWADAGTNWYTVSAYRRLADNAHASLSKGDSVLVTGRLRLREWESAGRKGMSAEIDAEALGPDLRWGTSRFTRAARAGTSEVAGEAGEVTSDEVASEDRDQTSASDAQAGRTPRQAQGEDEWSVAGIGSEPVPF